MNYRGKLKIKKYIILVLAFFCFLIPQFAFAACEQSYPGAKCVSGCIKIADTDPSLCSSPDQVCCVVFTEAAAQGKTAEEPNILLQVPLLGYTKAKNIAEYIKNVYQASLYLIIPFIIVMIIAGGVLWILAGGDKQIIAKAKERIKHALIGLGIALFSYVILYTIGGTLLTVFQAPQLEYIQTIDILPENLFKEIAGENAPLEVGKVDDAMARRIAQEAGVPYCVTKTVIAKESGGKTNAIGHDENVRGGGVRARTNFMSSGKKFSGATFSERDISASVFNDDKPPCSTQEDLCLDWRFSHGLGAGQITPLPGSFCNPSVASRKLSGQCLTAKQLMNPETNLVIGMKMIKSGSHNGQDWRTGFKRYNGGGARAEAYADSAMRIFQNCCSTQGGC